MSIRTYESAAHSLDSLRLNDRNEIEGETESTLGDDNDEGYSEADLPEHACTYCGLSDQACVVKCVESGYLISITYHFTNFYTPI